MSALDALFATTTRLADRVNRERDLAARLERDLAALTEERDRWRDRALRLGWTADP